MGGYAQACIRLLIGWLQSFVSQAWSAFTGGNESGLLGFAGKNWIWILITLCVAGALADLAVYMFRWEPVKVWKSYFRRKKIKKSGTWHAEDEYHESYDEYGFEADEDGRLPFFTDNAPQPYPDVPETYMPIQETVRQTAYQERQSQPVNSAPYMPTNVQQASDYQAIYRRPEPYPASPEPSYPEPAADGRSLTERNLEKVRGPRRRRIRVNELFSDPEDSAVHFESPQPVIDQTEAYHAPVYPRNWKANGDNQIEQ